MKILITGGAGFIGSNLCEYFISMGNKVRCLDNFSTGYYKNISKLIDNPNFELLEGDIRNPKDCEKATIDIDFVLHHAALGSVPRSIKDPLTTNDVNITGFLNMLIASKNSNVSRFIYAASSSTYGDSKELPKVEHIIGNPLSPYAITKYVNELYADIFNKVYNLETIGLRYFNVFGKNQDPNGEYAAVIPKFIDCLLKYKSPKINGDGSFSRDFTYIKNVIQMNELAIMTTNPKSINTVYNTAYGENTTLNELTFSLINNLSKFDSNISLIKPTYGPNRIGDIPHSLASIEKAKKLLNYDPQYSFNRGIEEYLKWIIENK